MTEFSKLTSLSSLVQVSNVTCHWVYWLSTETAVVVVVPGSDGTRVSSFLTERLGCLASQVPNYLFFRCSEVDTLEFGKLRACAAVLAQAHVALQGM